MISALVPELNRVPPGYLRLVPKICENCTRPVFGVSGSRLKLCTPCQLQLGTTGNQLWACDECGTWRSWGSFKPTTIEAMRLKCDRCSCVTEHAFVKVV